MKRGLLLLACLILCYQSSLRAQYRDDLDKAVVPRVALDYQKPKAIGNLGNIETVVDLRGFVPMLLMTNYDSVLLRMANKYKFDWFKVPTDQAIHLLYEGDLSLEQVIAGGHSSGTSLSRTRYVAESDAKGEQAFWARVAYDSVKDSPRLYEQFVGGGGFEGAEPVDILLTRQTAFVILNFRYSSVYHWGQGGEGQMLVALEFARGSRRYKTIYQLYSTAPVNKSVGDMFAASLPYIGKAIVAASQ